MAPEEELRLPRLVGRWRDLERRLEMDLKPSCFPELIRRAGVSCAGFRELAMFGSVRRGDALVIVNFTQCLMCLDLSRSHLPMDELVVIMKGCWETDRLSVSCYVGFQALDLLGMGGFGKKKQVAIEAPARGRLPRWPTNMLAIA